MRVVGQPHKYMRCKVKAGLSCEVFHHEEWLNALIGPFVLQ